MRTNIKDRAYFEGMVEESNEVLLDAIEGISKGETKVDRIPSVKRFIFSEYLHLAIARYSFGGSIPETIQDFEKAIESVEYEWFYPKEDSAAAFYFDWYSKLIWMLSISVSDLFSEKAMKVIIQIADNAKEKDWLLEYLISSRIQDRPPVDTLIFPKPYASLKKAVDETDPAKRSAIVKHYLEKEWYPGHKGVYWHDNHKSKHDTFFGYWSFEAAAVVKIAGIDDSSFRDNEYYPKDLL
jgi:hypothetical protein